MSTTSRHLIILAIVAFSAVEGFVAADFRYPSWLQQQQHQQRSGDFSLHDHEVLPRSFTRLRVSASEFGHEDDISLAFSQEVRSFKHPKARKFLENLTSNVPYGVRIHIISMMLGLFQIHSVASDIIDSSLTANFHDSTMMCTMAFGVMGSIYDNFMNAATRYVEPNSYILLQMHKLRYVWHVVSMPLLAIPVTELAGRGTLINESTSVALSALWGGMALVGGSKMMIDFDIHADMKLDDNRNSMTSRGPRLPGVVSYSTTRPIEVILPAILLVLYEIIVGGTMVIQSGSFSSFDFTMSSFLLLGCGVSTFVASGMGSEKPELQLFSEQTHMSLLWAAYFASQAC